MAYLLLFVVSIEGFTTLAMQLVALRNAIPLVGSNIVLTSVVIGIILLALAVGYRNGGRLTAKLSDKQIISTLARMLWGAAIYYLLLVFPFQESMLIRLVGNFPYIVALFVFSLLFFFLPVAAASHTMPMITQLTSGTKGFAAGKILFVSTIGSFLGSVLTSTVFFSLRGVHATAYITAGVLIVCHILLMIYQKRTPRVGLLSLGGVILLLAAPKITADIVYSYDSPYQQIRIVSGSYEGRVVRTMLLNGGYASSIDAVSGTSRFGYVREAEQVSEERNSLSSVGGQKKLLVIGAAGFTYPEELARRDRVERIDTIDIDPSVKWIAEKYFQQRPLNEKVIFIPQSARGFIRNAILKKDRYDIVLVDAYNGTSVPEELVTKEFFSDLLVLSDQIMLNMIFDKKLSSAFASHVLHTLSVSWPQVRYRDVSSDARGAIGNFLVTSKPFSGATQYTSVSSTELYTDDKHSVEVDKAQMFYGK